MVTGIDSKNEAKNILYDIEGNCQKLGFIINQRKTNLMVIKSPTLSEIVKVHDKKINWVANHKILGVHHQKSLDTGKQISYITEKLNSRLNVMNAMTHIKLGLNFNVLKTFYIACMRSIIDYSALQLVTSNENKLNKLEKIQNEALRLMLGAPRWTKLVNLRPETGIVPVSVRVQQVCADFVCRSLRRGRLVDLNAMYSLPWNISSL